MIMEDDMDWDIRLLSQMPEFAKGVRTVSQVPLTEPQDSPYGDDWDVLWPGHCGEAKDLFESDEPLYIINNDTTVAPKEHLTWLHLLKDYPEGTRIVHRGVHPVCTFAYGVSRRGAQKLLAILAMQAWWNLAFDLQLAFACQQKLLGLKCFSVEPMLFHHHRSAGPVDRDSDIKTSAVKEEGDQLVQGMRLKGLTYNIVWSARLNLVQMITGSDNYTMQW